MVTQSEFHDAVDFLEHKCAEPSCWHYSSSGYIYCNHCLHGGCGSIPVEERQKYKDAQELIKQYDIERRM